MANEDQNLGPQDPNRYLEIFADDLQAIRLSLEPLNSESGLVPKNLIEINKQMTQVMARAYQGAGPSNPPGNIPAPWLAKASPLAYLGGGAAQAPGIAGALTPDTQAIINAINSRSSGGGTTPSPAINPQLQALGIGTSISPNASVGGGGPSWASRLNAEPFRLPRFGQLTMQDLLDQPANFFAKRAYSTMQSNPTFQKLQALGPAATNPDGSMSGKAQEYYDQLMDQRGKGGGLWGTTSNLLGGMASGYEVGKAASQFVQNITAPLGNMRDLAYLSGYQGANQGFMGFNPGAVVAGMGQRASEMGFALNNNLTPSQAQGIYNNLFGLGWYGGQSTNAMRQGLATITQMNPILGTNPEVASMMDQATRMGQNSVNQFVDVMKTVPGAADAAHVSLAQMLSDMQNIGNQYVAMGGNALQGQQAATQFSSATGLPAGIFGSLLQSPLVQGQVFMNSGYMPGMQGLASNSNQMEGIFSTLNMLRGAVHFQPRTTFDAFGVAHQKSGQDQTYAWMSHMLQQQGVNISQAQIARMMNNETGIRAASRLQTLSSDYRNDVGSSNLYTNGTAWNYLWSQINQAKDWQGNPMFTAAQKKAILNAGTGPGSVKSGVSNQQIINEMNKKVGGTWWMPEHWQGGSGKGGGSLVPDSQSRLVETALASGKIPASMLKGKQSIAAARDTAIQKAITQATQKENQGPQASQGPGVTISLSGAAAKMFKLSSNTGSAKNNAGAGNATSVNVPYAGAGQGSDGNFYANPNTSSMDNNVSWGSTTNAPDTF